MMTHVPISHPENLKPLIKTAIKLLTEEDEFEEEYVGLRFCLAPAENGNGGYLLLGLSPDSGPHMRLRDILLSQPDSAQDTTAGPKPWFPPPYLANPNQTSLEGAAEARTPAAMAAFLKAAYVPVPSQRQRTPELRWVTTTLTDHPVEDTLPRYQAWEAEATATVTIDVMDNHTGIRYPALEGHTAVAARGLLVIIACALQHLSQSEGDHDPPLIKTSSTSLWRASRSAKSKSGASQLGTALSCANRSATRPPSWRSGALYYP
jgi:hypothetical protein